jgi:hypothetical protein
LRLIQAKRATFPILFDAGVAPIQLPARWQMASVILVLQAFNTIVEFAVPKLTFWNGFLAEIFEANIALSPH